MGGYLRPMGHSLGNTEIKYYYPWFIDEGGEAQGELGSPASEYQIFPGDRSEI